MDRERILPGLYFHVAQPAVWLSRGSARHEVRKLVDVVFDIF